MVFFDYTYTINTRTVFHWWDPRSKTSVPYKRLVPTSY